MFQHPIVAVGAADFDGDAWADTLVVTDMQSLYYGFIVWGSVDGPSGTV